MVVADAEVILPRLIRRVICLPRITRDGRAAAASHAVIISCKKYDVSARFILAERVVAAIVDRLVVSSSLRNENFG